jgi:hemolysin III
MHPEHRKELANTITHGLGLLVFLIAIPVLLFKGYQLGRPGLLLGAGLFSLGLIKVYSFSTLYHAARNETLKHRFRIMDHISIYWLIAGSYTPFVIKYVPHGTAIIFLACMWGTVSLGTIAKLFFTGKYDNISTVAYVLLGWMAVFIFEYILAIPSIILFLIAAGGFSYSFGVIFYAWKRYRYHHAVWHVCVLCGSICHFLGVFLMLG